MTTLSPEDRQFLKEFYQAVMDGPLSPDDPRYVALYEDHDALGSDPVELLEQTINYVNDSVQLLAGFRGIGKSTELRRLRKRLEDAKCKVVLVDIREYIDISVPIGLSQFLGHVASAFEGAMEAATLLGPTGLYGSVGGRSRNASGIWYLLDWDSAKVSQWHRLAVVREFFADCLKALRIRHGSDTRVVLIVDSVEHISGTFENAVEVLASIEKLFITNAGELRIPGLHVVYTIPPLLKMRNPNLGSLYSASVVPMFPAVKIKDKHDNVAPPGLNALLTLIKKRHPDASRLLSDDQMKRIIAESGGNLRELLRMLAEVIRRAKVLPANDGLLTQAIDQMRNESLPIAENDALWLAKIAKTHTVALEDQADLHRLARFFNANLVLAYRNGSEWYDVHPLIRSDVLRQAHELEHRAAFDKNAASEERLTGRTRQKTIDASDLAIGLMSLRLSHIRLLN